MSRRQQKARLCKNDDENECDIETLRSLRRLVCCSDGGHHCEKTYIQMVARSFVRTRSSAWGIFSLQYDNHTGVLRLTPLVLSNLSIPETSYFRLKNGQVDWNRPLANLSDVSFHRGEARGGSSLLVHTTSARLTETDGCIMKSHS